MMICISPFTFQQVEVDREAQADLDQVTLDLVAAYSFAG